MKKNRAITLLEILVVVGLIGILATFAIPGYWGVRARSEQRQAMAMVRLIYAAERVRFLETNSYTACADIAACNVALDLEIPATAGSYTYAVVTPTANTFTATATPGTAGGAVVTINQANCLSVAGGACT